MVCARLNYHISSSLICRKHGGLDINSIPRDEAEDLINKIAALEDQVRPCQSQIVGLIIILLSTYLYLLN